MKSVFSWKTTFLSLAAFSLLMTTSCKKDKEDNQPDTFKLLTGKNWQITGLTVDPPIDWFGTPVRNVYAQLDACSKDDITIFKDNGTVSFDEGSSRCDDQPQTRTGLWSLSLDKKVISVTDEGETLSYSILELSANSLKVEYEQLEEESGITYTFTGIFTRK